MLPPCIALSLELTRDEVDRCVFPSLLLAAGWDQTGPVVCPFQLRIWALPQVESPSGLRGHFFPL